MALRFTHIVGGSFLKDGKNSPLTSPMLLNILIVIRDGSRSDMLVDYVRVWQPEETTTEESTTTTSTTTTTEEPTTTTSTTTTEEPTTTTTNVYNNNRGANKQQRPLLQQQKSQLQQRLPHNYNRANYNDYFYNFTTTEEANHDYFYNYNN